MSQKKAPRQKSIDLEGMGHAAPIPAACRVGPILATSAVSGKDPRTGKFAPDADGQARLAFDNLGQLLRAGGMDFGDVVKLTCFVAEEAHREAINKYWLQHYPDPHHRPARHAIVSPLRGGALLQIEALAVAREA